MTEPDRNPVLCLASASPRRRELLRQIGIAHIVDPADVDETQLPGETAEQYVQRLARTKARSRPDAALPVLGADTAVVVDDQVLGKPVDVADARRMLALLSGREHRVLSAVALATAARLDERLSISRVRFAPLSASAIDAYVASGEPFGKAGGYAIQGRAAAFIAHLQGSYSGVMGLPLYETASLLADAAIP